MAIETERRFLITNGDWRKVLKQDGESEMADIVQGYLSTAPNSTVRIRTCKKGLCLGRAWITVKGKKTNGSGAEYEFEIPYKEGLSMLGMCSHVLKKRRYSFLDAEGWIWEVDVYKDHLKGLVIAEIELDNPIDKFPDSDIPTWVDKEITDDHNYANSNLAEYGIPA